jgi:hypothetical protein
MKFSQKTLNTGEVITVGHSMNDFPKITHLCKRRTKLFRTLIKVYVEMVSVSEWQFTDMELCANFDETPCPSSTLTESNCKSVSPVSLVAMRLFPQRAMSTASRTLENVMKNTKHKISGVRFGTILLKPGLIHWNVISHQEENESFTQQTQINIRSNGTIDKHGTEYSDAP